RRQRVISRATVHIHIGAAVVVAIASLIDGALGCGKRRRTRSDENAEVRRARKPIAKPCRATGWKRQILAENGTESIEPQPVRFRDGTARRRAEIKDRSLCRIGKVLSGDSLE